MRSHLTALTAALALLGAAAPAAGAQIGILLPPDLTRSYVGDDGSQLYTRATGTRVVGFGENSRERFAFVFDGTRTGSTISGRWWDVAKGARTGSGTMTLTLSENGAKLAHATGTAPGATSWTAVPENQMPWARPAEAGFQSTSIGDLDGAFEGEDGSRAYVRDTGSNVVWFAERYLTDLAGRPVWASVFIGTRGVNGFVSGYWWDVPKGVHERRGWQIGFATPRPRRWSQTQIDSVGNEVVAGRARSYEADYAVDYERFAQEIEDRLSPFVVGFGYAIAADGAVIRSGAGGSRRVPQPNNGVLAAVPFTADTQNEIASTSKTVTAVAVARALWQRGLTLDSPVEPHLPEDWTRGPGMDTVTFAQLLDHSAGLNHPGDICDSDPYECLRQAVANGLISTPGYNNIHYTVMRVVLPFLVKPQAMADLFDTESDTAVLNDGFSKVFQERTQSLLGLAGVQADFAYTSLDVAWRYTWGVPPTNESFASDSATHYLTAGSGGLKMSAPQHARFLAAFEQGSLVPRTWVQALKDGRFGFDDLTKQFNGTGDIGPLYTKNGGAGGAASQNMMYPGDVQAFITRNSTGNDAQGADSAMLRAAWQAALI